MASSPVASAFWSFMNEAETNSGLQISPASGAGPALVLSSETLASNTVLLIAIITFDTRMPATIWTRSPLIMRSTSRTPTSVFD